MVGILLFVCAYINISYQIKFRKLRGNEQYKNLNDHMQFELNYIIIFKVVVERHSSTQGVMENKAGLSCSQPVGTLPDWHVET